MCRVSKTRHENSASQFSEKHVFTTLFCLIWWVVADGSNVTISKHRIAQVTGRWMVLYCFNSRWWHAILISINFLLQLETEEMVAHGSRATGAFVDALFPAHSGMVMYLTLLSQKFLWHLCCGAELSTEVNASFANSESHVLLCCYCTSAKEVCNISAKRGCQKIGYPIVSHGWTMLNASFSPMSTVLLATIFGTHRYNIRAY